MWTENLERRRLSMQEVRKAIRHGTMATEWQGRIDFARMRKERLAKTVAAMNQHGIGAMFVGTGHNKRYATGVRSALHTGPGDDFALVFADGSEPIVFEQGPIWRAEREHITWLKPENYRPIPYIRVPAAGPAWEAYYAKELFVPMIYGALEERGFHKERLGVDGMMGSFRAALEAKGISCVDGRYVMAEARMIKTQDEIDCMKMAGAICDIAYAEMYDYLRPGRRENEVSAVMVAALLKAGIESVNGVTVRSGPNTAPIYLGRMPTDRIIQPGDLVYVDIVGATYMGYRSCYYRTFKVGSRPTAQEKDWFNKCRDYLYRAVDVLRDGVTSADVAAKWPEAKDFDQPEEYLVTANAIGHGVGLAQYEHPVITRVHSFKCPQEIKAGMTIAMETWAGQNDTTNGWRGGIRLENIWLVTKNGSESLYAMPDDHIICPSHAMYDMYIE